MRLASRLSAARLRRSAAECRFDHRVELFDRKRFFQERVRAETFRDLEILVLRDVPATRHRDEADLGMGFPQLRDHLDAIHVRH
ncbi:MAG: hypothetical protein NVV63_08755 [Opitutus sp.]|nr:hypothetical protein [Opitutus sp.]